MELILPYEQAAFVCKTPAGDQARNAATVAPSDADICSTCIDPHLPAIKPVVTCG